MLSVSAIIPHHNRCEQALAAIDSILRQSLPVQEIILVDDGSTQDIEALKSRPIQWVQQEQLGVSRARNHGANLAKGEWLAFLDSDDLWHPEKIERQSRFHQDHPELNISHTAERWIRNGQLVKPNKANLKYGGDVYPQALKMCFISPSTTMIKKEHFIRLGGFDEGLPAAEDYDFWLRLTAFEPIGYLDEELSDKIAGHPDQLSLQRGLDRYRVKALEKMLGHSELRDDFYQLTLHETIKRYRVLAKGYRKHGKIDMADHFESRWHHWSNLVKLRNKDSSNIALSPVDASHEP